jgi:ribosomal protein L23
MFLKCRTDATKTLVKDAIETLFDVSVDVSISSMSPKTRSPVAQPPGADPPRRYKKAIVTLAPGDTIDVFEGVR